MNVNWKKIHSIILLFTCHSLRNLSPTHTHPLISICEFLKPYELIIFWVWVICKRLNVNWKKNHSIILFVTCHSLRNSPTHTHPHIPIHEWNPMIDYFLCLSHSCKGWMSPNNFICHLSFLKKLSLTHTHPLISICEFSKPYEWLFLEFDSFVKC